MSTNAQSEQDEPTGGARPRRIAVIGNQAFTSIHFRGPLVNDLVAAGHTVYLLAPNYDDTMRAKARELGATPVDYPLDRSGVNILKDLRSIIALWRIVRRLSCDVVLSYFTKPVIYGTLAGALARVPRRVALIEGAGYVFAPDSGLVRRSILRRSVTEVFRLTLQQAHQLIVLNQDDRDLFCGLGVMPRERVQCLPGIGIDLEAYCPAPPVTEPITFCLAARLIEEKGVRVYAEAARRVKMAYPGTRFMLLGGIDENPSALPRDEIERWVDEGLLEWFGHVADVRSELAKASVFVLPSHYREGLPRSILEAMAMARPVITTDNAGCRDAVVHGECGYLVPIKDPAKLAETMCRFIENPQSIVEMGEASRHRAEAFYDVRAVNRQLIKTLVPTA